MSIPLVFEASLKKKIVAKTLGKPFNIFVHGTKIHGYLYNKEMIYFDMTVDKQTNEKTT